MPSAMLAQPFSPYQFKSELSDSMIMRSRLGPSLAWTCQSFLAIHQLISFA